MKQKCASVSSNMIHLACHHKQLWLCQTCHHKQLWLRQTRVQKSLLLYNVRAVLPSQELFNVINAADMDLRADFYKHIVLSGGTTMFPGTAVVTIVLSCLRHGVSIGIMYANFAIVHVYDL